MGGEEGEEKRGRVKQEARERDHAQKGGRRCPLAQRSLTCQLSSLECV